MPLFNALSGLPAYRNDKVLHRCIHALLGTSGVQQCSSSYAWMFARTTFWLLLAMLSGQLSCLHACASSHRCRTLPIQLS